MNEFYQPNTMVKSYLVFPRFLLELDISWSAKVCYALLLERTRMSQKLIRYIDAKNHAFVYYPQKELAKRLRRTEKIAKHALKELSEARLIERKRQGLGKADVIYLKVPPEEKLDLDLSW